MIAELKFCNPGPTRYGRDVATSLRAAVNKREQQLYQEYLTQLRLKDRKYFHTPAGTVDRGFSPILALPSDHLRVREFLW